MALVCLCTFMSAPAIATVDVNVIQQILYFSGSEADIAGSNEGVPELVGQIATMAKINDLEKRNRLRGAFVDSFDTSNLKGRVEEELSQKLTKEEADFLLSWFLSPLGRKISEEETTSHSLEYREERAAFIAKDQSRIDLVTKAWNAIGMIDYQITSASSQMALLFDAINTLTPATAQKISSDKIDAIISSQRSEMRNYVIQSLVNGSVFDYRNLSDEEVKSYEQFFTNEMTVRYYQIYFTVMADVSNESISVFVEKLRNFSEIE